MLISYMVFYLFTVINFFVVVRLFTYIVELIFVLLLDRRTHGFNNPLLNEVSNMASKTNKGSSYSSSGMLLILYA